MPDSVLQIHDTTVLLCGSDGDLVRSERDAADLVGEAYQQGASLVAIPAERLGDDFFQLRTGIAGAIVQKLVDYRLRLAVIGDIARHVEQSAALRDFVYETNRGDQTWFVADLDELRKRLAPTCH